MANENFEIGSTLESESFGGNFIVPVGTIMMFAGPITQTSSAGVITTTAPDGWLLCNGQTFIQANYPILYDFLNSTTLPNMTDRYLRGAATYDPESISSGLYDINTPHDNVGVATSVNPDKHTHSFEHNLPFTYNNAYGSNFNVIHSAPAHAHGIAVANNQIGAYNGHSHLFNYASRTTAYASNSGNFVGGPQGFVAVNGHIHDTGNAYTYVYNEFPHYHNTANVDYGYVQRTHEHRSFSKTNADFGGNANENHRPPTYFINFIVKAR
jgi:microcystin-dependent protein